MTDVPSNRQQVKWEVLNEICREPENSLEPLRMQLLMRARVPGGWLVKDMTILAWLGKRTESAALTFYPDPKHQWDGWSMAADAKSDVEQQAAGGKSRRRSPPKRSSKK